MDTFVYPKLTGMGVRFTADVAAIGSFSCVGALVRFEKIRPAEALATVAAAVGLLSAVCLDVDVERGCSTKRFGTRGTAQKIVTDLQILIWGNSSVFLMRYHLWLHILSALCIRIYS